MNERDKYVRDYARFNVSALAFEKEGWIDGARDTYVHAKTGHAVDRELIHTMTQAEFYAMTDELLNSSSVTTPGVIKHLVLMARTAVR